MQCHLQPTGYIVDEMAHVQTLNGTHVLLSCPASATLTHKQRIPHEKLFNLLMWYLIVPNNQPVLISLVSSSGLNISLLVHDILALQRSTAACTQEQTSHPQPALPLSAALRLWPQTGIRLLCPLQEVTPATGQA